MNETRKNKYIGFMKSNPQLIVLITIIVILSVILPTFTTVGNISNILKQSSVLLLLSCGMTFVVIAGNLDLSMGSVLTLCLCIAIRVQVLNPWLAYLVPFIVALVSGLLIGFIVGRFEANSIIATLGMMVMVSGIAFVYTNGSIARGVTDTVYSFIGTAEVLGIPIYAILAVGYAVVCHFILNNTRFGRSLYYIGVNKEAAEATGMNIRSIIIKSYLLSALSVALAATVLGSRLLSAAPTSGTGYEFDALTAILVGGIALTGGKGTILNTFVGVLLVTVMINGLTQLNMPYEYQSVVKGVLVMISILTESKAGAKHEK